MKWLSKFPTLQNQQPQAPQAGRVSPGENKISGYGITLGELRTKFQDMGSVLVSIIAVIAP